MLAAHVRLIAAAAVLSAAGLGGCTSVAPMEPNVAPRSDVVDVQDSATPPSLDAGEDLLSEEQVPQGEPPRGAHPDANADALAARNTEVVLAFYGLLFDERRVAEAFARYVGDTYIQHSPGAPDDRADVESALAAFVANNPNARFDVKRVIAQGDLVALHVHATVEPGDPGQAVVDIFRVENGKLVEHWDVVQPVPANLANVGAMF